MIENNLRNFLSVVLSLLLVTGSSETLFGYQGPANAPANATDNALPTLTPAHLRRWVRPTCRRWSRPLHCIQTL